VKPFCWLITILVFGLPIHAQPTGNVISRVYQIRFGGETATSFLMDYEDRQYFVTARHVMKSAGDGATVSVEFQGLSEKWKTRSVTVLLGKNECVDVAILVPADKKVSSVEPIPYPYSYAFGQEAYFMGFPYGLSTSIGDQGAVALIKHAYISARVSCASISSGGDKDEEFILLDGFNNPGFSGGPIIAPDVFAPLTNVRVQKLIGVVGGFVEVSAMNTGIIYATPIKKAIDLIKVYVDKQKKP
jgi:S1-C subfamily serine protease